MHLQAEDCFPLHSSSSAVSDLLSLQRSLGIILTEVDNFWYPYSLIDSVVTSSNRRRPRNVRIISEGGTFLLDVLKIRTDDLLQRAQHSFAQDSEYTMSRSMCAMLGWPGSATITKVSVRDDNKQKRPKERVEDILEYIRTSKEPWAWIETSSSGQESLNHNNNQADDAWHPIIQLETWVDELAEQQNIEHAKSLFALLRLNGYSCELVKELTALYAPFRQRNTVVSQRAHSQLKDLKDRVEDDSGSSPLEDLECLALELDEMSVEDARAIFRLVRRGFGTCRDYMDELKVILGPLQQRHAEEFERAQEIKRVFEAIDNEAQILEVW
jgi:hypothetical protein